MWMKGEAPSPTIWVQAYHRWRAIHSWLVAIAVTLFTIDLFAVAAYEIAGALRPLWTPSAPEPEVAAWKLVFDVCIWVIALFFLRAIYVFCRDNKSSIAPAFSSSTRPTARDLIIDALILFGTAGNIYMTYFIVSSLKPAQFSTAWWQKVHQELHSLAASIFIVDYLQSFRKSNPPSKHTSPARRNKGRLTKNT